MFWVSCPELYNVFKYFSLDFFLLYILYICNYKNKVLPCYAMLNIHILIMLYYVFNQCDGAPCICSRSLIATISISTTKLYK